MHQRNARDVEVFNEYAQKSYRKSAGKNSKYDPRLPYYSDRT